MLSDLSTVGQPIWNDGRCVASATPEHTAAIQASLTRRDHLSCSLSRRWNAVLNSTAA